MTAIRANSLLIAAIAERLGLAASPAKGYVKYFNPAFGSAKGAPCVQVWVGATGAATQVDLVNFTHPVGIKHKYADRANWYGSVAQQLDMGAGRTESDVLQDFLAVGQHVMSLKPVAKQAGATATRAAKQQLLTELPASVLEALEPQAKELVLNDEPSDKVG